MIFLGDVAHPFTSPPDWSALTSVLEPQPSVINLEGPLTDDVTGLSQRVLFNHVSVLPALRSINTRIAGLANNHILDLPDGISTTRNLLDDVGISGVGADRDLRRAGAPVSLVHGGREYVFVAFGWPTIQCPPAGKRRPGTNPLDAANVPQRIARLRTRFPEAVIIPLMHWNYELEPHPQPAHRRMAFAMVEAGADLIIGHHPHCVGGFEYFRKKLIAWSLGNWWLPQSVYFNGQLRYPDYSLRQVALEWHPDRPAVLHHFLYSRADHAILHQHSRALMQEHGNTDLTPYAGATNAEYLAWFRANRIKRSLLPIYKNPDARLTNQVFDALVALRHPLIMAYRKIRGR